MAQSSKSRVGLPLLLFSQGFGKLLLCASVALSVQWKTNRRPYHTGLLVRTCEFPHMQYLEAWGPWEHSA